MEAMLLHLKVTICRAIATAPLVAVLTCPVTRFHALHGCPYLLASGGLIPWQPPSPSRVTVVHTL